MPTTLVGVLHALTLSGAVVALVICILRVGRPRRAFKALAVCCVLAVAVLGECGDASAQPLPTIRTPAPTPVKVKKSPVFVALCAYPAGVPKTFDHWALSPTGAVQGLPTPLDLRAVRDDAVVYTYAPKRAICRKDQSSTKAKPKTAPTAPPPMKPNSPSKKDEPQKPAEKKEATRADPPKKEDASRPTNEPNADPSRKRLDDEMREARRRRAQEMRKTAPPPPRPAQARADVKEVGAEQSALQKVERSFETKPMTQGSLPGATAAATRGSNAAGFHCRAASAPAPSTHRSSADPATTTPVRKPILDELLAYRKESDDDGKEAHRRELWILFESIAPPLAEAFHAMLATQDTVGVTFRSVLYDDPIQQELLDLLKKKYICQPLAPPPPPPAPPEPLGVMLPVASLTDEASVDELHKWILDAINDLDEGADNLTSVGMIPHKIHLKKDIVRILREEATKAKQEAHAAFQGTDSAARAVALAKAGDHYLGILVTLPLEKLDLNTCVVAEWADAANESSFVLNEPIVAYRNDKDIRALLEAATTSDRTKIGAALPAAVKRVEYYTTRLDQLRVSLKKSAILSKRVLAVADMLFIAISIYQVVKTPVIASGGPLPPIIGLGGGGAAVGSSMSLASIARTVEAIRRLIAIGALDGAIIGGIGMLGGRPGVGMPELQRPVFSVAAPKGAPGATGVPESPAARAQRIKELVKEAQKEYPKKAGKTEQHHKRPIYLRGPRNGETVRIDAAYHQKITNEFRKRVPYGTAAPKNDAKIKEIMDEVYEAFPLPE